MKYYKFYFIILAISLTIISCKKDWLNKKADKNQAIPTTLKDFQAMLDYTSVMNFSYLGLSEIASDGHYVTDLVWPDGTDQAKNAYTWSHDKPYINISGWNLNYQRIFYSNLVLDGLKKIIPGNNLEQQDFSNIKGQALFNRAECLYSLTQVFAPPYSSSASSDLGIPLRLDSDITIRSSRSSIKQCYDQIISDLLEAKDLIPMTPVFKTRGSKPAIFALLARIYLSMEDYSHSKQYSDSCLNLYSILKDYNALPTTASYIGDSRTNPEILFDNNIYTGGYGGFLSTNCLIDTAFYAQHNLNDLRRTIFFRNNSGTITFKGNYTSSSSNLFCGLATDEVYLIRAECAARIGNKEAAMNDLNALMIKRWKNNGSFIPFTAVNADDALNQILQERKKELFLRGIRWSDLRRLNKDPRFQITLTRTISGKTFTITPGSYKYTFPIPDDIIQIAGIEQNQGW